MSVTIFPPTCRTPRETAFFALAVAAVRRGLSPLSSGDLLEISRSFSLLLSLQSHMEGLVEFITYVFSMNPMNSRPPTS